jgi:16S rRNA (uracil1498-N3)-methyltransferase
MRRLRCHLPSVWQKGELAPLEEHEAHHLLRVLRVGEGHNVDVFNGSGLVGTGELRPAGKKAYVLLHTVSEIPRVQGFAVCFPLIKSPLLDDSLEQLVELGASDFFVLQAERSTVHLHGERWIARRAKWERAFQERLKQCERAWLPTLHPEQYTLGALLQQTSALGTHHPVALWERGSVADSPFGEDELMKKRLAPLFLIGPEGGWSPEERVLLEQKAVYKLTLTPAILRSETALIAAGALAHGFRGN